MAVKKGLEVTVLTPLLKQLAGNCQNLMAEGKGDNFAGLAKSALTMLLEKKNITGQKAEKLSLALDFVTEQTGVLPLAKGGDGKCFSIRVEKAYCNGCALCAKACAFNALCMRTEPLREAEDVPFTRTGQGLCPGGFSLPGRAFWQLLSDTLEEMVRPGITAFAQKISLLVEKIQNELRTVLDELERNERESVLEKLNALLFILQKGSTGRGRAPALILLWAGENFYEINNWPFNAFSQPVFVRSGQFSCPHLRAVTEAHFRHCLDNIRLFRKVSLEMEGNYKPAIHDAEIAALDWFDLSPEEAAFIPPVVMVTDRNQKQAELLKESVADLSWPVIILNPPSLENDFFGNYEKELRDWNYTRIKAEQDRPVVEKVVERRKNTLIQLEERRIALREKLMALCGYGTGAQEG
jgi:ferredoxin